MKCLTTPSKLRSHRNCPKVGVRRFSVAEWLSIAQLLALIAGGIWTATLFLNFEARDRRLNQQRTILETQRLSAAPLAIQQDILIWRHSPPEKKLAENLGAEYNYAISNASNQKVRIVQIEVNAMLLPQQPLGESGVLDIPPPSISPSSAWKPVLFKRYLAAEEQIVIRPGPGSADTVGQSILGGGGTGDIEPSEVHWGGLTLLVQRRNYDFIGFYVDALIRFPDNSLRWVGVGQGVRLEPGEYLGSSGQNSSLRDRK